MEASGAKTVHANALGNELVKVSVPPFRFAIPRGGVIISERETRRISRVLEHDEAQNRSAAVVAAHGHLKNPPSPRHLGRQNIFNLVLLLLSGSTLRSTHHVWTYLPWPVDQL